MRHRKAGYKLGRTSSHRTSTLRNLSAGLIEHGQVTTTVPKAKALQPFVEKLVTLAKQDTVHRRRIVASRLRDRIMADDESKIERNRYGELKKGPKLVKHLFEEVAPRFAERPGGYTRIVRLGKRRVGDAAELCVIQFVGDEDGPEIGGRISTRRRIADKRTAFAAKLRKGGDKKETAETEAAPEEEAPTAEEAPVDEAPSEEAAAPEAEESAPEDESKV